MTRKSRREIEDALNRLQTDDSDAARGVTAPFVTYEEGTPDLPDVPLPADDTPTEDVDENADA